VSTSGAVAEASTEASPLPFRHSQTFGELKTVTRCSPRHSGLALNLSHTIHVVRAKKEFIFQNYRTNTQHEHSLTTS